MNCPNMLLKQENKAKCGPVSFLVFQKLNKEKDLARKYYLYNVTTVIIYLDCNKTN